LNKCVTE